MSVDEKTHEDPQKSFDACCQMLSKFQLSDLWQLCSQLSVHESMTEFESNPYFSALNLAKLSIFAQAILNSEAFECNAKALTGKEFIDIASNLTNALSPKQLPDNDAPWEEKFLNVMYPAMNTQVKYQRHDWNVTFARTILLWDQIPRQHDSFLKERHQSHYVNLPEHFRSMTGLTIKEYLFASLVIYAHYLKRYTQILEPLTPQFSTIKQNLKKTKSINNLFISLQSYIDYMSSARSVFAFSIKDICNEDYSLTASKNLKLCMQLLARTTFELREMAQQEPYIQGDLFNRLSPLERFPIVALDKIGISKSLDVDADVRFVVPNIRLFEASVAGRLRYAVSESSPDQRVNEVLGSIQELYLLHVARSRLKNHTILNETSYKQEKNWNRSPDLVIFQNDEKRIVVVESKGRNFTLPQRLAMGDSKTLELFDTTGLKKTVDRLEEMKETRVYGGDVDRIVSHAIANKEVICVLVFSDGPILMDSIVRYYSKKDPNHYLYNYPYRYCIMDLTTIEKSIEISRKEKRPLFDVLHEYQKDLSDWANGLNNTKEAFESKYKLVKNGLHQVIIDEWWKEILEEAGYSWSKFKEGFYR